MNPDFWESRWREGQIGFHEGAPNVFLNEHVAKLGASRRVLVPLCGKSEDLAFLAARGHAVVGVELVDDAVRAFFAEHGLTPTVTPRGVLTEYSHGPITLFSGDFFATTRELLGPVDALYDRAALIALPESMRARYVAHLRALLPAGADGLVITVEYPQEAMEGPPFSVPEAEVRRHYQGLPIDRIDQRPAEGGRLAAMGAAAVTCAWRVRF
ncbi:MAG: thiopurine S-methyltransferase [Deltaproteobacteria bacterium]|jgi:thiopurine S-methyltransferase|nr:thiopurine S-methyltransferase [Deltaproteobacteria bacterium]MBP6831353.1 thiopurine S-methyltransferase [Deltaproteobacteria bacterium]